MLYPTSLKRRLLSRLPLLLSLILSGSVILPRVDAQGVSAQTNPLEIRVDREDLDHIPDGWKRINEEGFPPYNPIYLKNLEDELRIQRDQEQRKRGAKNSLKRIEDPYLRGRMQGPGVFLGLRRGQVGLTTAYPIPVSWDLNYQVHGRIRTLGLQKGRAFIQVQIHDHNGNLLQENVSRSLTGTTPFTQVIIPVGSLAIEQAKLTVRLLLEGRGDFDVFAWFDDLRLDVRPRTSILFKDEEGRQILPPHPTTPLPGQGRPIQLEIRTTGLPPSSYQRTISILPPQGHPTPDLEESSKKVEVPEIRILDDLIQFLPEGPGVHRLDYKISTSDGTIVLHQTLPIAILAKDSSKIPPPTDSSPIGLIADITSNDLSLLPRWSEDLNSWGALLYNPIRLSKEIPPYRLPPISDWQRVLKKYRSQGRRLVGVIHCFSDEQDNQASIASRFYQTPIEDQKEPLEKILSLGEQGVHDWLLAAPGDTSLQALSLTDTLTKRVQSIRADFPWIRLGVPVDVSESAKNGWSPPANGLDFVVLTVSPKASYDTIEKSLKSMKAAGLECLIHFQLPARSVTGVQRDLIPELAQLVLQLRALHSDVPILVSPLRASDSRIGLLDGNGYPTRWVPAIRTLNQYLASTTPRPSLDLVPGLRNKVFFRSNRRVFLGLWTRRPSSIDLALGPNLRIRTLDGWSVLPDRVKSYNRFQSGPEPLLLENIDPDLIETLYSFRFDNPNLDAETARLQTRTLSITNRYTDAQAFELSVLFPPFWRSSTPNQSFSRAPNETHSFKLPMSLPPSVDIGENRIRIIGRIGDRIDFELWKKINVSPLLKISPSMTRVSLRVEMLNLSQRNIQTNVYLRFLDQTEGALYRNLVTVGAGDSVTSDFRFPHQKRLDGQRISIMLRERGGPSVSTHEYTIEQSEREIILIPKP
ncbi:MAG: hypothetical protein QF752_12105 [Planctomycetota bacterium]|nr:hypothetical protein [Planctomycetota bacterium]